jgi:hypothetical protein
MKKSHFRENFNIYVKNKNWNSPKNDYDMDLWKSGPFQAIQKFTTFKLSRIF